LKNNAGCDINIVKSRYQTRLIINTQAASH